MIDMNSVAEDYVSIVKAADTIEGFYSLEEPNMQYYKSLIKQNEYGVIPNINYDIYGSTFNAAYFTKNLLKNLLFLREIIGFMPRRNLFVRDIGCGPATSSAALSLLYKRIYKKDIRIELIDHSRQQLLFAKHLLEGINAQIQNIIIKDYCLETEPPFSGMSLFSYFLCEQDYNFGRMLYQNKNMLKGGFVVIDYEYVIHDIYRYFQENNDDNVIVIDKTYSMSPAINALSGYSEIVVHGCYYCNKGINQ